MNEEFKVKFRGVRGSYPCANKNSCNMVEIHLVLKSEWADT